MRLLTALPVLPYRRWQNQPTTSTFTSLKHSRRPCAPLTAKQSVFLRIQVRASSQTKGLKRGWKQWPRLGWDTKVFLLSPHTPVVRVMLMRLARARLFSNFFTDFEKKTDCFAVYVHLAHECRHNLCCQYRLLQSNNQKYVCICRLCLLGSIHYYQ